MVAGLQSVRLTLPRWEHLVALVVVGALSHLMRAVLSMDLSGLAMHRTAKSIANAMTKRLGTTWEPINHVTREIVTPTQIACLLHQMHQGVCRVNVHARAHAIRAVDGLVLQMLPNKEFPFIMCSLFGSLGENNKRMVI